MSYTPPPGWVEPVESADHLGSNALGLFHERRDCNRVRRPELLRPTDKPYSAARCPGCRDSAAQPDSRRPPEGAGRR